MAQLVEMYGNAEDLELMGDPESFELMGNDLEELDGEQVLLYGDDGEFLGRSLIKKIGGGIKKVGRTTVKAAKYVAAKPGRLAAVALAPVTGGASLLTLKAVRKPVVKVAKATGRVTVNTAKAAAKSKLVRNIAATGARAGAAYVTGGGSELALQAAKGSSNLFAKKTVGRAPVSLPTFARVAAAARPAARSLLPKRETTVKWGPTGASIETTPTPATASTISPMVWAGGGVGLLALVAMMTMGKKK